ncbi:GNAT family N-acetyltransferase [Natrarchaeobaculum aegyptiacum]|uniref:GNAT family N-acetyltransferase n=1 Tax=Natrarchaeobaculum aegyptiacum TaxID=745377 RepID=A0A2Z2HNS3_9EURY|nr:GNAT family N-acetyltransferase [Natrarchaeobaculum aegyptiacum]ARS88599.1 GNAT family N-acetyltransferase [Natrarchaeobaculum aegyptiacum]
MSPRIRLARPADAETVRAIYAPFVESTPVSFELEAPSMAEMAERIETTLERFPWLVCETADGTILGYAAASSLRSYGAFGWTVELSVYVAEDVRNGGIGTALYTSLLEVLQLQGYRNAYAVMTLPNPASVRLHERVGFEPVATFQNVGYKDGEWHDVRWWFRQVAPCGDDPDPPTPLPDLVGSPALARALEAGTARLDG